MEKVFNHFDTDGDGQISATEFALAIRSLEPDVSEEEARDMMKEMDTDGNGFIDFREFSDFLSNRESNGGGAAEEEKALMDAFKVYDLNGDGRISAEELKVVLGKLGNNCSLADCTRMIQSVDANGDGKVDFQEFKKMMACKK